MFGGVCGGVVMLDGRDLFKDRSFLLYVVKLNNLL